MTAPVETSRETGLETQDVERRADPRFTVRAPVTAVFRGKPHLFYLRDISRSGARLDRLRDDAPPQLHTLELDGGTHQPVRVLARTVRLGSRSHAVRFVALDEDDQHELAEAIDRLRSLWSA